MVQLPLAAVPAGLTRLTHLQLINRDGSDVTLPTSLTSLRELTVAVPGCTSIRGLTNQAGLQRLHVACVPSSIMLADLGSLTSLRHLELSGEYRGDPGALTVFGSLQQLTHLTLCGSLLVGVLEHAHRAPPHLQELVVTGTFERFSVAALERWLRQLPALRKLRVDGCMLNGAIESLHLPEGLQELTLRMIPYMQQLPAALSGLSTLRMLDVSGNTDLEQLPACLSGLRSLEEVNWEGNPVNTQQVLADMPGLRRVWVLNTLFFFVTFGKGAALDRKLWHWHVSATRNVYGAATHLHYGGLRPL
jgi:Leucine-rich repeat (LRR) protein